MVTCDRLLDDLLAHPQYGVGKEEAHIKQLFHTWTGQVMYPIVTHLMKKIKQDNVPEWGGRSVGDFSEN